MNKFLDNLKNDKKKVIFFGIIALLILILIIILIVIIMNIFKRYDYDEIKTIMVQETKDYLRAYPELVPDEENPSVTIEASTLISEEYMKDFSKLSTDQNCTGNVVVTYNNDTLRYTPTLSCDRYETVTLKDTILEQENIVTENEGLYELNDFYTYRGENVNNYVSFANELWRIVKFNDEMMYLILSDTANQIDPVVFDDRYNETINSNRGYNSFENSRIRDSLLDIYNDFFANYHGYLLTMDSCVHTRSETDHNNTGAIECYTTYETPISLLPVYDFINGSIDPLCRTATSGNCANYNYLSSTENRFWLLNGTNENTYQVYVTTNRGILSLDNASSKRYLRVYIAIPSDVEFQSGNGTSSSPYTVYTY